MRTTYYTKKQVQNLFDVWGVPEDIPKKKGDVVLIAFPAGGGFQDEATAIAWSDRKSDSGERLYEARTGVAKEVMDSFVK